MTSTFDLIDWREKTRSYLIILILLIVAGVCFLVYFTGGIKYVFSHSMYLPIVIAAIIFGVRGGLLIGLLGGLVLGPFMPIDTATGEMQNTINWLYRIGFFLLVGFVVGFASDRVVVYLKEIKWRVTHDQPTGLPNGFMMAKSIRRLTDLSRGSGYSNFLLGLALSNANEIELNFGVNAVNQLLSHLAGLISGALPSNPSVYRISHDCLGVILPKTTKADMMLFTQSMDKIFKNPLSFGDLFLHGDVYLGGILLENLIDEPATYIEKARHAVSEATIKKQQGAIFVSSEFDARVSENIELLGELTHALEVGQLTMHYQPKIITQTGYICGAEALMRWNHPVRGMVPPDMFIPRAEESTLIDLITYFAIDQALGQIVKWNKEGITDMRIAVNISTRNLMNRDFDKTVRKLLDNHGIDGEYLELEITETSFMEYSESIMEMLTALSKSNIILSIDDFGTGYSSLQYLAKLPVSVIKIDQAFVRGLPNDIGSIHIVESTINLAHKLGIKVVAEGVETSEACDFLRNTGCDILQGYYASRPIPADEFDKLYRQCNGRLLEYSTYSPTNK